MTIDVPAALEDLVRQKVETGDYANEADVVSSALELLALRDSSPEFRRKMLLAALEEGEADIRAGRYVTLSSPEEIREHVRSLSQRQTK